MKTHFYLIDLENVQPSQLELLRGDVRIKIFLGQLQTKIPVDLAAAIQAHGPAAEYVKVSGNGPNALDFHVAYYLGRLAVEFPDAVFHIISKDTGFDPLVAHLKSRKISCERSADVKAAVKPPVPTPPVPKPPIEPKTAKAPTDPLERAQAYLASLKGAKPAKLAALRNALKAHLGGSLTEAELDVLLKKLQKANLLRVEDGGKVSYLSELRPAP